jgi:ankyrin repeat protein
VNCVEVDGWTPLHIGNYLNKFILIKFLWFYFNKAAQNGHVNVVETLIKHGANKEAMTTSIGSTPLYIGNYINNFILI